MLVLSLVSAGFALPIGRLLVAQGLLYSVGFTIGWIVHYPHAQRDARCEERVSFGIHAGASRQILAMDTATIRLQTHLQ